MEGVAALPQIASTGVATRSLDKNTTLNHDFLKFTLFFMTTINITIELSQLRHDLSQ